MLDTITIDVWDFGTEKANKRASNICWSNNKQIEFYNSMMFSSFLQSKRKS